MIGAAFGVGFILGPALGGVLGVVEPRLPFWVAAAMPCTSSTKSPGKAGRRRNN